MAELSKDQIAEVIARVTREVNQETKSQESAFGVADLRAHVAELAKVGGGERAWKITYDTSSGAPSIERLKEVAKVGGSEVAWKITYDTSSGPAIEKKGQGQ